MQKPHNLPSKYTIEAAIQRADTELGDRELGELEATLAEDEQSVSILLRARKGEWFAVVFDLTKTMRPHVFQAKFREPVEAFFVAAIALHRTGYPLRTARALLPAAFRDYLDAPSGAVTVEIDLAKFRTALAAELRR
jgi:hypothetical protein